LRDGSRRITSITSVGQNLNGEIQTLEIFKFNYFEADKSGNIGALVPTGNQPPFMQRLTDRGITLHPAVFKE